MKNTYGGPLRQIVSRGFHLRHVVGLHGADAFEGDVDAYPSVFTIERTTAADSDLRTAVVSNPTLDASSLAMLADMLASTRWHN